MIKNNYKPNQNRCTNQPFIIVGCLIKRDTKILFVEENGKYNLPQGWLELGEKLCEGAKREAEEETGLTVKIKELSGVYTLIKNREKKKLHAVKFIFIAEIIGKINPTDKSLPITWLSLENIVSNKDKFWDKDIVKITTINKERNPKKLGIYSNYCCQD